MVEWFKKNQSVILNGIIFFLAVIELSDVKNLIPAAWTGSLAALAAVLNLVARFWFREDPVANRELRRQRASQERAGYNRGEGEVS